MLNRRYQISKFGAWFSLCLLLIPFSVSIAQNDTLQVLFLGNSHTYYNNLPHLFKYLSESGGYPVEVDSNTPPGYTLEGHSTNPTSLAKIAQGGWDYVILQENSMYPVIDFYRYGSMYPSAALLDSLIRASGSQTALFMTWGWRGGGQRDLNGHYSVPFVDYFHMQDTMTAAYIMLDSILSSTLVPAGCAWARAMHTDTTLDLWSPYDNYHPNLQGSYLAACVFYAIFFHQSPVGLTYRADLTYEQAQFLQLMAEETTSGIAEDPGTPVPFELLQNYPNPFNAGTTVRYILDAQSHITLEIYDLLGRNVETLEDSFREAGVYTVIWDGLSGEGEPAPSGVYFMRLSDSHSQQTQKILLLR